MKNRYVSITALALLAGLVSAAGSQAAVADEIAGADDTIEVCANNSLSTLDATGNPLGAASLSIAVRQVQELCDAGVGTSITFGQFDHAKSASGSLLEYANVVAQINNSPGNMGISAYANSLPRDGKTKELSCIYRQQPLSGPASSWSDCGARQTTTDTYLTTRGNDFCPVPGSRWEAYATLYVNGSLEQDDTAIAVAL